MHGVGENGPGDAAALNSVQNNGPPKLIKANQWPGTRPFVVLSPQHPGGGCPTAAEVHDFLTYALGKYDVDAKRVYLTGLSCGALGSSSYFAQYGSENGRRHRSHRGRRDAHLEHQDVRISHRTALWAFHGDADPTVLIDQNGSGDKGSLPKFLACPKPPKTDAQYTVYPGVGHDSWSRTYDLSAGHDIYTWMLTFSH